MKQGREDSGVPRDEISTRMVRRGSTEKFVRKQKSNSECYLLVLKRITRLHLFLFNIHISFLFSLFQFSISRSLMD